MVDSVALSIQNKHQFEGFRFKICKNKQTILDFVCDSFIGVLILEVATQLHPNDEKLKALGKLTMKLGIPNG